MKHVLSINDFDRQFLFDLFEQADKCRYWTKDYLTEMRKPAYLMATLFYEPSTRTRLSFEAAMIKSGGQVISTEAASQFSSHAKGESLEDTIRVVSGYADLIVLRHPARGAAHQAAKFSSVPVINAGDGDGEHPSQAMLDAYTIWRKHGRLDNLRIVVAGDLKYGRAANSLLDVLALGTDNEVSIVSTPEFALPIPRFEKLRASGLKLLQFHSLTDACQNHTDVVYMTRLQRERIIPGPSEKKVVSLSQAHLDLLPPSACVMHPLPRLAELPPALDKDPRVICFEQAHNGLYVRMALIDWVFRG